MIQRFLNEFGLSKFDALMVSVLTVVAVPVAYVMYMLLWIMLSGINDAVMAWRG